MNKFFRTGLFFFALLLSGSLFAQDRYDDVVYLKNGGIIRGMIIEQVPNESLKIQTHVRNVFVYRMDEIQKITKEISTEPGYADRRRREKLTRDNIKQKGYLNILEITFGRDILDNHTTDVIDYYNGGFTPSIGVQDVNGYLFNPYVSAGIGMGIHTYSELTFIPLFADVRYNFLPGPVTPTVSLGVGYSFGGEEINARNDSREYTGGIYINPAFGIKFNTRKTKALSFTLGYRYQKTSIRDNYDYYYGYNYVPYGQWHDGDIGYLNFKVGFLF